MTQEEKDLLLKDLSARLPYGLQIHITSDECDDSFQSGEFDNTLRYHHLEAFVCDRIEIKPYLRPMSSMTKKEKEDVSKILDSDQTLSISDLFWEIVIKPEPEVINSITGSTITWLMDWFYEHHFDINDLILKGFALKAPEDMY